MSPLSPSSRALALGLACAGALAVVPAAGAATTVQIPAPAAGEVAVVAAPVAGTARLSVPKAGVAKGAAVTGGVVAAGGRRVALVAVIRPRSAGRTAPKVGAGRAKVRGAAAAAGVLGSEPPAALTAAVAPACSGAAKALGHPLRRGAGAPSSSDLATLGKVLAARLCGKAVDDRGTALLGLLGLEAPAKKAPAAPLGGAPAAAASTSTTPPPAPPAGGGTTTPPSSGGGTTAPPAAAPQCSNGVDDDGDGQVDAFSRGAGPLFDPGCSDANDTTEDSEKPLPAACGKGVVTQGSRVGFAVEIDARKDAACPKDIILGVVDLVPAVKDCENSGWDDGHGDGACYDDGGIWRIGTSEDKPQGGDAWHGNGIAAASLCGTRAVAISYAADGGVWERDATIADPVGACTGPVPPAGAPACADGIDNDFDGQIDTAGVADSGPDPGCTSAADADESEAAFPATGCTPTIAADPDDPTIAYAYLMPWQVGHSCPAMDQMVLSLDYLHVTGCVGLPAFDGAPKGTCAVKKGDAWIGGASGQTIGVGLQLDAPIGCDTYVLGQIDMHAADGWHEAVTTTARFTADGQGLEECPSRW